MITSKEIQTVEINTKELDLVDIEVAIMKHLKIKKETVEVNIEFDISSHGFLRGAKVTTKKRTTKKKP